MYVVRSLSGVRFYQAPAVTPAISKETFGIAEIQDQSGELFKVNDNGRPTLQ